MYRPAAEENEDVMRDFDAYHQHTEELISWLIDRHEEDAVLAAGLRRAWWRRLGIGRDMEQDTMRGYRNAVTRSETWPGAFRAFWRRVARYHASGLRQAAYAYENRSGFDRSWLKPPR
jgi:hypothetical protein